MYGKDAQRAKQMQAKNVQRAKRGRRFFAFKGISCRMRHFGVRNDAAQCPQ